jgi:uncharacterized protein
LAFDRNDASLESWITKGSRAMLPARLAFAAAAVVLSVGTALAQCVGANLIAELPAETRDALVAKADAVPFANGNFWRATKGDQVVHLLGTYHADDLRHDATIATVAPLIGAATSLLVEAGPEAEKALMARMSREPGLMLITDGPTLPELLPKDEWQALSQAMTDRGIPGFMAAKFRPWYISIVLSLPSCSMQNMQGRGLDGMVMEIAKVADVPISDLEPYDTVFGIFGDLSIEDQLSMIRATMATESQSEDFAVTLADTYFAEESRLIWEFMRYQALKMPDQTPEAVEAEFARMEDAMMIKRNRAWIPVIEEAATKGPVFAAFGSLHLSGKDGVLNLLQDQGYTLKRLELK